MTDLIICNDCNELVEDCKDTRHLHTMKHFIDSWVNYPKREEKLFGESTDWGPDPAKTGYFYTCLTSDDQKDV